MKRFLKGFVFVSLFFVVCVTGIFIYISAYDLNYLKPIIEKAAFDATGRKLSIQGRIYIHVGWPPGIRITDVTLENAQWSNKPHMLRVGELEVDVKIRPLLNKTIHIKQLTLNNFYLSIEINKKGDSNLNLKTSPEKQSDPLQEGHDNKMPQFGFNHLCLNNINLSYENANEPGQLSLTLKHIDAQSKGLNAPVHMDIMGAYRNHSFDIQAEVGSIHSFLDTQENWPLTMTAQGAGMSFSAIGSIQDVLSFKGANVEICCKGEQFRQFQEMMAAEIPLDGPYHFQMALKEKKNRQYQSSLEIALGNNHLMGVGELHLDREHPGLKLVFESNNIDLRPFITQTTPSKKKPPPENDRIFSDQPLLSHPLSKIDFIGLFRIKSLITPRLAIHDINTQIRLSHNAIEMKSFNARIGGGKLAAQLKINSDPQIKIFYNMITQDMNVGQMLKELNITKMYDGVLDMRVHLASKGRSLRQWMAQLDGYVSVQMENGKLYNQYVNMLGGELSSNVVRLINPLKKNQYARLNCMATRFDITSGQAHTTIMMLDTDQMRVVGDGHISLMDETIDISIKPLPKSGLDTGRLGKFSLSLSELAQPFKLGGTLKEPQLKLDYKKAAWTIGKTVGGVVLFGPVGIAAGLITGVADNDNPCEIAKSVARTGKYPDGYHSDKSLFQKTTDSVQQGINSIGKSIGDTFNKLWGND